MEPYQATLFRELGDAGVSYVVCGGLAITLHGIHRFTADIDLAVALEGENLQRFVAVVTRLGYRPRAPVPASDLLDPENRRRWQTEKHAFVFTFIDPALPYRQVDVFLEDPLPFATLQAQSILEHGKGYVVRVASLEHLLAMEDSALTTPRYPRHRDVGEEARKGEGAMSEPEWTDEVRQDEWSLEMIFRWLEESAAFLYEIEAHRRPGSGFDSVTMTRSMTSSVAIEGTAGMMKVVVAQASPPVHRSKRRLSTT